MRRSLCKGQRNMFGAGTIRRNCTLNIWGFRSNGNSIFIYWEQGSFCSAGVARMVCKGRTSGLGEPTFRGAWRLYYDRSSFDASRRKCGHSCSNFWEFSWRFRGFNGYACGGLYKGGLLRRDSCEASYCILSLFYSLIMSLFPRFSQGWLQSKYSSVRVLHGGASLYRERGT